MTLALNRRGLRRLTGFCEHFFQIRDHSAMNIPDEARDCSQKRYLTGTAQEQRQRYPEHDQQ